LAPGHERGEAEVKV